jgi:hypothetical protein
VPPRTTQNIVLVAAIISWEKILAGDPNESQIIYDTPLNQWANEFILTVPEIDQLMAKIQALPKREIG